MTLNSALHARSLLIAATAIAGLAFGVSLITATQADARSVAQVQRDAKQPPKSFKRQKIIKPLEPSSEDHQKDPVPPRVRDYRKKIDRLPARPGAGRLNKTEVRVRDYRPGAQADRVPAHPGKRPNRRR